MLNKARNSAGVSISPDFRSGEHSIIDVRKAPARFIIEAGVSCRRFCSILVFPGSTCVIGKNVFFNNHCSINCVESIQIGENSIFGESVKIYDHNHRYSKDESLTVERDAFTTAPVVIGKNCWIGSNVTILKGVTIGDNVIIGASCLIHKSIPSNSVVMHKEELVIQTRS